MFIEQGVTPENKFWKYIVGALVIFCAAIIGQLPLTIAILMKVGINVPSDTGAIMRLFDSNLMLFLVMLSYVAVAVAIYFVVKLLHRQSLMQVTTSRKKFDWSRFFFSFTIWGFFSVISTLIVYYVSPESFVLNFKLVPFLILVVVGTLLIPIQTSCEEYIFRGYLMQGFANLTLNKWFPSMIELSLSLFSENEASMVNLWPSFLNFLV
jgi:membrane protease YdiL (CAAX protease family)